MNLYSVSAWYDAGSQGDLRARSGAGCDIHRRVRGLYPASSDDEVELVDRDDDSTLAGPTQSTSSCRVARRTPRVRTDNSVRSLLHRICVEPPDVANEPLGDQRLAEELTQEAQSEMKAGIGPWIETSDSSTPVYVVGPSQRCVPVHLDVTQAYGKTLSSAFQRVPLPADAHPAAGSDAHLTLIQPSTDSMSEFWKLRRDGDAWHASWGGAIHDVSASPGYYTSNSWPGAKPYWGASATSLPWWRGR